MRSLILLVASGCAAQISQDRATGPDGTIEGAQRLTWSAEGRAEASGVVTYPGGDRVDWWFVRLPDTLTDLEIELRWRSPRPGLRLAFDVFGDDHGKLVDARRGVGKPVARASLSKVRGGIFVRVYARERGDAGAYTLVLAQTPSPVPHPTFEMKLDVPDPPDLPEVPRKVEPCSDPAVFDPRGVTCKPLCPPHGPPGQPGCSMQCPNPPDVNVPACWSTMPCPNPPDPRVRACAPSR